MKLPRTIWVLLLMLAIPAVCSSQQAANQQASAQTPPAEEKPRSRKETKIQLENLSCGPEKQSYRVHTEKSPQPLPPQPEDKALVYVFRQEHIAMLVQAKLGVDGKWVGANKANAYFTITLDPGAHYFCSEMSEDYSLLSFVVEAGKTYYIQQKTLLAGAELDILDEQHGKEKLAKCKPSSFEEKK